MLPPRRVHQLQAGGGVRGLQAREDAVGEGLDEPPAARLAAAGRLVPGGNTGVIWLVTMNDWSLLVSALSFVRVPGFPDLRRRNRRACLNINNQDNQPSPRTPGDRRRMTPAPAWWETVC